MVKKAAVIATLFTLAQAGAVAAQGSLQGTITAAGTGSALAGAQVSLPDLSLGAITGPNGAYEVGDIPAGTHEVVVVIIGYQTERRQVTITDGQTATLNVALAETALELEGLVAVGSRARPRTVTESPVPVDVIPTTDIVQQGDTDFANLLRNVVPSFNVNIQPISDAATFARPANLRGLAPDHTLVLINGKRRHRTAVITWYGNGLADGSQGPDIALIPGLALEQAEVLRDGAAAQYGSDAIAGVMNFVLRNDRSGGSIEFKSGGHLLGDTSNRVDRGVLPGDGDMYTLSGNIGLPLGETGFLNLTGEYGNALPTDRSVQRDDALALINTQGNTSVRDPAQIWGSPEVSDEIKLWANTGYVFGDQMQFYGHGNYVSKTVEGGFYFRNPNTRSGVFGTSDDDGAFLLVGDLLDAQDGVLDGSAGCPRVAVSGGVVTDQAAWQELLANPNCWTFQKMFPGGFTPQFGANVLDASAVAGLKGAGEKLSWDASAAWGKSNMDFYMYNTVNSSLGPDQPCATDQQLSPHVPDQPCTPYFHPGIYDQQETNLNVDLSYAANERVNFAGGAEFRNERFEIVPGDRASWTEGPLAAQGFTPGSNGFTGFGPLTEGVWNRNNFAVYSDLEIREPEGAWTFGVAGRFENFSDFGSTINGKVAARVSLSEAFALRMSASTGFRAPTPGQSNAFNISTIYDPVIMDLTNNGTIPSTSDLAMEYGGEPLTPETSVNLALGGVVESGNLSMSFDAYQIRMSDRLTFTQDFSLSPPEIDRLLAEGIIRPGGVLARFRFFINDFSTKSEGIDWVAAYRAVGGDGSATTFSTAWNLNRTVVTDHNPQTLSAGRIRILEEGLPNFRGNISVNHDFAGGTRVLARISHWGGYYDGEQPYYEGSSANTIDYPSRNLIDLEAARTFADNWTLTVGAQNVLNTFPQEYPGAAAGVGNTYGQFTPFGFNGGFYYTRLNYSW
ncbi:MAG: TonB-dependent receptor [Gemmatimonadetes bacterium]|nr:TonB-dependent receptor [Gemmatimonadota bacterium]MYG23172.1 TonB-dependent receptor [Gemmatimonadota bacterium]MYJ38746.1 TonB-dependent receptor [Gemmatimonadota bacterium]